MVKLLGVVLLMTGSTGFAYCMCMEGKRKLFLLKEMKRLFVLMQDEIKYSGLPIAEVIKSIAGKVREPYAVALRNVGDNLTWEEGRSLQEIWEKEMISMLTKLPLSKQQKELFVRFPDLLGMSERAGQAEAFKGYLRELEHWIIQIEQEEKNKNKLIMSMGMATGVLLSVLLL